MDLFEITCQREPPGDVRAAAAPDRGPKDAEAKKVEG